MTTNSMWFKCVTFESHLEEARKCILYSACDKFKTYDLQIDFVYYSTHSYVTLTGYVSD